MQPLATNVPLYFRSLPVFLYFFVKTHLFAIGIVSTSLLTNCHVPVFWSWHNLEWITFFPFGPLGGLPCLFQGLRLSSSEHCLCLGSVHLVFHWFTEVRVVHFFTLCLGVSSNSGSCISSSSSQALFLLELSPSCLLPCETLSHLVVCTVYEMLPVNCALCGSQLMSSVFSPSPLHTAHWVQPQWLLVWGSLWVGTENKSFLRWVPSVFLCYSTWQPLALLHILHRPVSVT